MITYKGYAIIGNSGLYSVIVRGHAVGPFRSYAECQSYIDGIRY